MSINLPKVDLTNANVGDTFSISLANVGIPQDFVNSKLPIHIRFFNDSCIGLNAVTQKSGKQFYIPQGGWPTVQLRADETGINFVCSSQMLPVPSICFLQPVYYGSGEMLDDVGIHGNTPTNLGGSGVSTNTVSNEGNPINTLFIDGGPIGLPQMIQIFNDHFIWSVVQAGVAHQVLSGSTLGNPLQIGQANDVSEIMGKLLVDQLATFSANVAASGSFIHNNPATTSANSPGYWGNDSGGVAQILMNILSADNDLHIYATPAHKNVKISKSDFSADIATFNDVNGLSVHLGTISLPTIGTLKALTSGAGTGNGTSNTLITNPTAIVFDPCTLSGSSQTIGGTTTTTTTITTGAGLAWRYIAYLQ